MKNFKLWSVSGIGIYLHWTFLAMLAGIFGYFLYQGASVGAALAGVALMGALFGCVILHELGHAFMARRFGVGTRDITMYPIGGVARLDRMPREPKAELLIALAGPAVNLALAGGLYMIHMATGQTFSLHTMLTNLAAPSSVLGMLIYSNLVLAGFNMLPAFPMDGGRVLRAGLATQMPHYRATHIAAFVGQVMAALFFVAGLVMFNPVLMFIAVFVFAGARQEAKQASSV